MTPPAPQPSWGAGARKHAHFLGFTLLFGASLLGCGVAGRPLPPGPRPPAAPTDVRVVATPEGFEIEARRPTRDLDGEALATPPRLLLFVDDAACAGLPAAQADAGPLVWAERPEGSRRLHVVAAVAGRMGAPAAPVEVVWTPGPPAPDAPLAFLSPEGGVQLAWLPAEAPVEVVVVLRDGVPVGQAPADAARFVDPAPPGRHRYAVAAQTATARSAPSPEAEVVVPAH